MSFKLKDILKYIISLAIGAGLLWYAFKDMDFQKMIRDISKANFIWIFASMFISIFGHLFRALRWNLLLEPVNYKVKTIHTFQAILVGYLVNFAVPRLGEVSRCGILKKTDNIPVNTSFGTVVTERIIDLLSMCLLILITLVSEFDRVSDFFFGAIARKYKGLEGLIIHNLSTFISILVLLGIGMLIIYLFRKQLLRSKIIIKVKNFLAGMMEGFLSVRKLKNQRLFVLYTVLIWLVYYLMTYLSFFAIPESSHLGPMAGFVVLVLGSIGMAAPVQGGIGTYHILVSSALVLYGLSTEKGLLLATIIHFSQMMILMVMGFMAILSTTYSFNKKNASVESAANTN